MVRLERVARRFGARVVFEDLSWVLPREARLGLVGPNGAGKTTLLRLLAGHESPDAGAVHRPAAVSVGYLPQEVEAVAGGSVLEVVLSGFPEVAQIEAQLEHLAGELAGMRPDDPRLDEHTSRYGALRERYEALGGDRLESRARAILDGLGVERAALDRPLGSLSGGWRMRVVLARLLLAAPELLLLDEPTNHLDLDAIEWLEAFLAEYDRAFVVVSHDRYFLNRMVRGVVELERGRLTAYPGDYDEYVVAREAELLAREKAAREQAREIARVERFIERFRYKATKARQVQSRIRALEKVDRVRVEAPSATIRFGFPPAPRSGDVVVRVEGASKQFDDRVVFAGVDLLLRRGDRVALVGPNGCGEVHAAEAARRAPRAGRRARRARSERVRAVLRAAPARGARPPSDRARGDRGRGGSGRAAASAQAPRLLPVSRRRRRQARRGPVGRREGAPGPGTHARCARRICSCSTSRRTTSIWRAARSSRRR